MSDKDDGEPDPDGLTQRERYDLEESAIQRVRREEPELKGTLSIIPVTIWWSLGPTVGR